MQLFLFMLVNNFLLFYFINILIGVLFILQTGGIVYGGLQGWVYWHIYGN